MAELVIIDDKFSIHNRIHNYLEGTEHKVVDDAYDLHGAHQLLARLALGDVSTDYVLLDGNLWTHTDFDGRERGDYNFRFTPPGKEQAPLRKRWWHNILVPLQVPNPHEVIVPFEPFGMAPEGRHLSAVIRRLELDVTIIGISSDPASTWGPDGPYVDFDLTKDQLKQLPQFLDWIETERA